MSRSRASALLVTLAVMLSTMVGTTAASAAPAAPSTHYPPPPPSLVVDRGVVKRGVTVWATGRKFDARERVTVVVRFTPKGSTRSRTLRVTAVYTDRNGRFYVNLPTRQAGSIEITATGRSSGQSATAVVFVIDKRKFDNHHKSDSKGKSGGGVAMKPAAFTDSTVNRAAPEAADSTPDTGRLAIVGLAAMVMAGGALVTQRTIRRRRKAD
jgi:hypothetical protein